MNDGNQGDAGRAARYSQMMGALLTARALAGQEIDRVFVERLRSQVVERIRQRAAVIAERVPMVMIRRRHGLTNSDEVAQERLGSRVVTGKVTEHLQVHLAHSKGALDPAEIMRIHKETAEPVKPNALGEKVRQLALRPSPNDEGSDNETPPGAKVACVWHFVSRSVVCTLRFTFADNGCHKQGQELSGLPYRRQGISSGACCRRSVCCKSGARSKKTDMRYRCAVASDRTNAAHPTWAGIPNDTEWHLKQMRVKEAWALKPPAGGKSRGEGILIGHPDTGWREHVEYDQSQLRFDLARNVIEGRDGKEATRHGSLTIPPFLFQTHGTAHRRCDRQRERTGNPEGTYHLTNRRTSRTCS